MFRWTRHNSTFNRSFQSQALVVVQGISSVSMFLLFVTRHLNTWAVEKIYCPRTLYEPPCKLENFEDIHVLLRLVRRLPQDDSPKYGNNQTSLAHWLLSALYPSSYVVLQPSSWSQSHYFYQTKRWLRFAALRLGSLSCNSLFLKKLASNHRCVKISKSGVSNDSKKVNNRLGFALAPD